MQRGHRAVVGPPTGSGHDAVTIETTDDNREIDSQWVITDTGQVTADGLGGDDLPE